MLGAALPASIRAIVWRDRPAISRNAAAIHWWCRLELYHRITPHLVYACAWLMLSIIFVVRGRSRGSLGILNLWSVSVFFRHRLNWPKFWDIHLSGRRNQCRQFSFFPILRRLQIFLNICGKVRITDHGIIFSHFCC